MVNFQKLVYFIFLNYNKYGAIEIKKKGVFEQDISHNLLNFDYTKEYRSLSLNGKKQMDLDLLKSVELEIQSLLLVLENISEKIDDFNVFSNAYRQTSQTPSLVPGQKPGIKIYRLGPMRRHDVLTLWENYKWLIHINEDYKTDNINAIKRLLLSIHAINQEIYYLKSKVTKCLEKCEHIYDCQPCRGISLDIMGLKYFLNKNKNLLLNFEQKDGIEISELYDELWKENQEILNRLKAGDINIPIDIEHIFDMFKMPCTNLNHDIFYYVYED